MALDRDILLGGHANGLSPGYGFQACDQNQKGKFDIEAPPYGNDGVQERVRALKWFNSEDFDKGHFHRPQILPEPAAKDPAVRKTRLASTTSFRPQSPQNQRSEF